MYLLEDWRYGWQRFGETMDNTFLDPFIEGAWMTKHKGKYYLQYGAPGTEFSGYADGVVVGTTPLFDHGPVTPQSDPLSFKSGGFSRGAGHGATFQDNQGRYWHTATSVICVKNTWERRIGIWPAGFDADNVMWCNTAFGDYPQYLPAARKNGQLSPGWMLLNYKKSVTVSSTFGAFPANHAVDENIKTYWSAKTADKGEWIQSDLSQVSRVNAIQINYADQDAMFIGKQSGIYQQYEIYASLDGKKWSLLVAKSRNTSDLPHDYVELLQPVEGTAPDKLYNSIMIYDFNEYWFKAMDSQKTYYFCIESVNEHGVSARGELRKVD